MARSPGMRRRSALRRKLLEAALSEGRIAVGNLELELEDTYVHRSIAREVASELIADGLLAGRIRRSSSPPEVWIEGPTRLGRRYLELLEDRQLR